MPHFTASELGLHCLHNTLKRISGLKRVNYLNAPSNVQTRNTIITDVEATNINDTLSKKHY